MKVTVIKLVDIFLILLYKYTPVAGSTNDYIFVDACILPNRIQSLLFALRDVKYLPNPANIIRNNRSIRGKVVKC